MTAVLFVNASPEVSGAEQVLLRRAAHLQAEGWDVRLACPRGDLAGVAARQDVAWSALPAVKLPGGPKPLAALRMAMGWLRAARVLRRLARDVDVVVVNSLHALPAATLARLPAPMVWHVHDVVVRPAFRRLVQACRGAVDLAVAVSASAADGPAQLGVPVTVVRNGVAPGGPRAPDAVPPGPPVFGVVARLTPWKGQDVAIRALAEVDPSVQLELVGGAFAKDGPYEAQLRALAVELGVADRVHFAGQVSDVRARMARWTGLVSCSVDPEAGPLNVLEAMSAGVPVVATDHGGAPEILAGRGILVPPGDHHALAAAMERLRADDGTLRRAFRDDLTDATLRSLTVERSCERFERALRVLLPPAVPGPDPAGPLADAPADGGEWEGRPARVLFLNEGRGGHDTVHHHWRRALADHDHVTSTMVRVPDPGLLRRLLGAPVPGLARLDLDLQPLRAQLAAAAVARRILRRHAVRADAVHVYTQNAALLAAGVLGPQPCVVSTDSTNELNAYRLPYRRSTRFTPLTVAATVPIERRALRAFDLVVANTDFAAESLRRRYRVTPDRLVVRPAGLGAPRFDPPAAEGTTAARPVVTFVGRQFTAKGGASLLDAHAALADRCDLVLVTTEEVAPRPGVRVVDDIRAGDASLWSLLRSSAVLAFPSTIDQAPNAVLEGMAAGLPVVACAVGGIPSMVDDGVTGILVPPDDTAALIAALARLLDDSALRAAMGEAGRRRFDERFALDTCLDALLDDLRRVATGTRATTATTAAGGGAP